MNDERVSPELEEHQVATMPEDGTGEPDPEAMALTGLDPVEVAPISVDEEGAGA